MSDSQYLFEYNCQKMELLKLVLIIGFATAAFPGQSKINLQIFTYLC